MNFNISIEACRVNAKLTQAEMASKLGVSTQTIGNWEKGITEPSFSQLKSISEISGVPVDFIFVPSESNINGF